MSTPLIMPLVTTSKLTNAWRSQGDGGRTVVGIKSDVKKNDARFL